jgi:steroid delta-isomerase-like uncharacterized protein
MKMDLSENEELIHQSFAEWNKGSSAFFIEKTSPDYVLYSPSGSLKPKSREETVDTVKLLWKGFPDIQFRIEELITAEDRVIVRFIAQGTHRGEFMGIPATYKSVRFSGILICIVSDGMFIKEWEEIDTFGLLTQLGAELILPVA